MMRIHILAAAMLAMLFVPGCGLVYTHTIRPLDVNFKETRNIKEHGEGDIKEFSYSLVNVQWDSNAIGDIARRQGFETVYYADIEVLRILLVWNQYKIHVYGR
jgi:hypothetical protein